MAQSLQFFRRIMLLLNVTVGAFLVWVFGMTPVLAARQSDGVAFAQNLSALPAKPWTLAIAVLGMAALILAGVLRRRGQDFIGWTEPLFALCVIFALHLAYNGLLLYVVVDLIDGLHGRTRRRFLGAMTALFLLTGLGALQGALHAVPFSEYLLYFDMHTRQLLQSVVDLLGALHLDSVRGVHGGAHRAADRGKLRDTPPERRTRAGERPALCHERAAESLRRRERTHGGNARTQPPGAGDPRHARPRTDRHHRRCRRLSYRCLRSRRRWRKSRWNASRPPRARA